MPTASDVIRMRQSTTDETIMNSLMESDSEFRTAVERVQSQNPEMGALETAKFPTAMLDIYYDIQTPEPVPEVTQAATRAMETQDSFFRNVAEDIQTRGERFGEGLQRDQSVLSTGLQLAGETVGGAFDVAGEALAEGFRALPDFIEEPIREGVSTAGQFFAQTETGQAVLGAIQQGAEAFEQLQQTNPELAENLRAIANIASALPIARAGAISKGAGRTGRTLQESGEAGLRAQKRAFIDDLVSPVKTKKIREAQVPRQREVGFRKKTVTTPTPQEARAAEALIDIDGLSPNRTKQFNFNVIQDANVEEAKSLTRALKKNDFNFPKKELSAALNRAKKNLQNNPAIVGDAEKTAQKLIDEINRRVKAAPAKGSSLLKVRKEFDQWVKSQKGANIFDPNRENAFSIANREIRSTINDFIDTKAINVDVKSSLQRQRSLFDAMENIIPKAAVEADTAFLRGLQRVGEVLGVKSRIVQGIAAAVGIGGLGAAATFAPAAAVIGGLGVLTYKGGRLVLSPRVRTWFGKAIQELEKLGATAEIAIIRELLDQYE